MLSLRPAGPEDAEPVRALVVRAYRGRSSRRGWTTEADLLDDERIDLAGVRDKITQHLVLVAYQQDRLVACCELHDLGDSRAYFGMFAVEPDLQAAGLGRRVLAEAERQAASRWGARSMEMTVIAQRAELIAWYERRGYRRTGQTRPFPYAELVNGQALRDDLHFVVLSKPLQPPLPG